MSLETGRAWRPLLDGDDAAHALDTARDIARTTEPLISARDDASLVSGAAGQALLNAHLHAAFPGQGHDQTADRQLTRAAGLMRTRRMGADFFGGFPGVVWAVTHVDAMLRPSPAHDRAAAIDDALAGFLGASPWRGNYDLVSGLAGHGVYAIGRLPRPRARECAESVVARLGELAQVRDGGVTWHTPPQLLPPYQRELCPNGYYNLGLAHGVPGIVAVLGMLCAANVSADRARRLLDGGVSWLLSHECADPDARGYPAWLPLAADGEVERAESPARIAWCYGDLGLAAGLFVAARAVGEASWEEAALSIARRAAARPASETGVVDAGLCHGAAGVGHIFNRLYQATGEAAFAAAARQWIMRTMDMRDPSRGGTGYAAYTGAGQNPWEDEPGLLSGAAGVALTLLSAATDIDATWDRWLLLSVPPLGTER